ncbi:LPS export ABC transporter permease LptG [Taylorella asinigenitalis]|uniref:Putative Permease n=1 Tax=Taylorella asinigenitalis (strain MCE3) TaxID=1008459 RepID=G4QA55_TAYAM|nr:LPS export ABC transporter permease LptG [Taylorella asinigenitalis]AEP37128.1 putative Permease [Taylorella asinigenitalis MCE3]
MKSAIKLLSKEIYKTCALVILVLLGLFTFFETIEEFDKLNEIYTLWVMLALQAFQLPTRLYDILPIGLLIGAVVALANLAQRNELVILRVSGLSSRKLLLMLWWITVPIVIFATLLSEVITPWADQRVSAINMAVLGKKSNQLDSGYWFREPSSKDTYRVINLQNLIDNKTVEGIKVYEYSIVDNQFKRLLIAEKGELANKELKLFKVIQTDSLINMDKVLNTEHDPVIKGSNSQKMDMVSLPTSLTESRLLASELKPDRMSTLKLLDYLDYLEENNLEKNRHVVALWRKLSYPFALIVMITLATPLGFVQNRKGGVGAKIFIGILIGIVFFMVNQLSLNMGMLSNLPPWITALLPNIIAMVLAMGALYLIERKPKPKPPILST